MTRGNSQHAYFSHRLRVRFADTDLQGHVFFGNYYTYLDEALMACLRELGYSWQSLAERGLEFYYVESGCSYQRPCYCEDRLEIRVAFGKIGNSSLRAEMSILRDNGEEAARGFITAVLITAASGRPCPLPDDLRTALAGHRAQSVKVGE